MNQQNNVEYEALIQAAAQVVMRPILRLLQSDPHQWSTRPCPTCAPITAIIGEPFGCDLYRQQQRPK